MTFSGSIPSGTVRLRSKRPQRTSPKRRPSPFSSRSDLPSPEMVRVVPSRETWGTRPLAGVLTAGRAILSLRPAAGRYGPGRRSRVATNNFRDPGGPQEGPAREEVIYMAMRVRPLQDRVIVRRVEEQEQKSAGGIIIPDTAKEKPQEGKVVAVGPGKKEDGKVLSLDVKAGDRVLFGKYAGTEIKLDGEEHLILREEDILGVIEA